MRITNNMLSQNYLNNLHTTMGRLSTYQQQLATEKRITVLSDDPIGSMNSIMIRGKISLQQQYERNIDDAKGWLNQSETAVLELNDVIKNIYEKTVQATTGTNNANERKAVAIELEELRDHIVQLANTKFGDKFIFGGYQTDSQPVTYEGEVNYQGIAMSTLTVAATAELNREKTLVEIGEGLHTAISIPGTQLLGTGDENIIKIVDELIGLLQDNKSTDELSPYIDLMQSKQQEVLTLATEIGGRLNRLDLVSARYDKDLLNYQQVQSKIEDIDLSEVVMQAKMAQSVYTAALSIGSYVIVPSLADFLR